MVFLSSSLQLDSPLGRGRIQLSAGIFAPQGYFQRLRRRGAHSRAMRSFAQITKNPLVVGDRFFVFNSKLRVSIRLEYWCCYVGERSGVVVGSFLKSAALDFIPDDSRSYTCTCAIGWASVFEDFNWCRGGRYKSVSA